MVKKYANGEYGGRNFRIRKSHGGNTRYTQPFSETPEVFDKGIWDDSRVIVTGGSQNLGDGRYRLYSATGAYSSIQINDLVKNKQGKYFRFTLTVESIATGSSLVVGDDVGNDIVITGVGKHVAYWITNGPTVTIKRHGGPTDLIVSNISVVEVNRPPVSTGSVQLGDVSIGESVQVATSVLLGGVTDPDGDVLTVTSVTTGTPGATITGTGPYILTTTVLGEGAATIKVSDGRGGEVERALNWKTVSPIVITSQPTDAIVVAPARATFSVTATSLEPLFYEWFYRTTGNWASYKFSGSYMAPTFITGSLTPSNNGWQFRCRIRRGSEDNSSGEILSDVAVVTVLAE